jgi:hypothetical protein
MRSLPGCLSGARSGGTAALVRAGAAGDQDLHEVAGQQDLYSLILWADSHGGPGSVELNPLHYSEWPEVLPPPSSSNRPARTNPGRVNRET